jgi:hypothetical protein
MSNVFAQKTTVRGNIQDSSGHVRLDSAAVIILNDCDSVLVNFKRTSILGTFEDVSLYHYFLIPR